MDLIIIIITTNERRCLRMIMKHVAMQRHDDALTTFMTRTNHIFNLILNTWLMY